MSKSNADKLVAPNLMSMAASASLILQIANSSSNGAGAPLQASLRWQDVELPFFKLAFGMTPLHARRAARPLPLITEIRKRCSHQTN
jgi:hypothetical protein